MYSTPTCIKVANVACEYVHITSYQRESTVLVQVKSILVVQGKIIFSPTLTLILTLS